MCMGFRSYCYPSPFPPPSISWCFSIPSSSPAIAWISFVLLLYDRRICTHSVDPSLTHFLREFPGLGLGIRCSGTRGGAGARTEQKILSKFLPWPELESRPLARP